MEFAVDKEKAVEALVYVASRLPKVGRFHAAKILYFAEQFHLASYGRPIFGDRYIAMDNGPVPSFAYDVLKGTVRAEDARLIEGALYQLDSRHHPEYIAARNVKAECFSVSDMECLDRAIAHCAKRTFGSISDETHKHPAWIKANLNGPMDYEDMLVNADSLIAEDAREFAAYGIL